MHGSASCNFLVHVRQATAVLWKCAAPLLHFVMKHGARPVLFMAAEESYHMQVAPLWLRFASVVMTSGVNLNST